MGLAATEPLHQRLAIAAYLSERLTDGKFYSGASPQRQRLSIRAVRQFLLRCAGRTAQNTFASVNAVVRRLQPQPEFILFLGDEIIGLTPDAETLRAQWNHWLEAEMAWLDRGTTPVWHTTSNHATYDAMSEEMFRDVLKLPDNGPPGQVGLSYFVRRNDLLMVFVHTSWSGLGGEGHVETGWLETTLQEHQDARHKLVLGHHPVFPINGFSGAYQRELGPEYTRPFWDVLVKNGVLAYVCSHILAFDVQVHSGVLQICTAGAERPIGCRRGSNTCIVFKLPSMRKACAVKFWTLTVW